MIMLLKNQLKIKIKKIPNKILNIPGLYIGNVIIATLKKTLNQNKNVIDAKKLKKKLDMNPHLDIEKEKEKKE